MDTDERLLDRSRAAAAERGLAERVGFLRRSAEELEQPADLVVCVGEGIWEPLGQIDESLVYDDVLGLPDLAGLVAVAIGAGFRPLYVETANRDEWEAFESGFLADDEEWLFTHPAHAAADRIRTAAGDHRIRWLRGYRNGLGFAYLTLGRPA